MNVGVSQFGVLLFNKLGPEKEDLCRIVVVHSFNFILDCLGEPWDIFAPE
jgi:hypothetical protein